MAKAKRATGRRITDYDVEVGRRIRLERERAQITQVELAEAIGVAFQQLQKYERGDNRASAGRVMQIAEYLEIPIAEFFEGLDADSVAHIKSSGRGEEAALLNFARSAEGKKLYEAFQRLQKPESRKLLLKFIQSLEDE